MGKWCRGRRRIGANKRLKTVVFVNAVLKVAPKVAPKLKSGPIYQRKQLSAKAGRSTPMVALDRLVLLGSYRGKAIPPPMHRAVRPLGY